MLDVGPRFGLLIGYVLRDVAGKEAGMGAGCVVSVEQRLDAVRAVLSGARITEEAEPVLGLRVGGNPQVGGYFSCLQSTSVTSVIQ